MASYFNLTLDTTGPSNPTISLNGGDTYTTSQIITATIGTGDGVTTGYQIKVWGDVDLAYNASIQDTEVGSAWITYTTAQEVKLLTGDGTKTVYLKIRDDVYNESSQASDTITLNTAVPVASITGPSVSKISKIASKDESTFSFTVDVTFDEYKVKVVSSSSSTHDTGVVIPTTAGSSNMAGAAGGYPSGTPINSAIKGADLETASSGDGIKIIKVFVKTAAGIWSL